MIWAAKRSDVPKVPVKCPSNTLPAIWSFEKRRKNAISVHYFQQDNAHVLKLNIIGNFVPKRRY